MLRETFSAQTTELSIDEVLPAFELPPRAQTMSSPSGHAVRLDSAPSAEGTARLTVTGPKGDVQLRVELTPNGPVLHFSQAEVQINTDGAFRVNCDVLELSARSRMALRSGGDLQQRAEQLHEVSAGGRARVVGHDVRIAARRGNVELKANDDVRVDGERIWLNR